MVNYLKKKKKNKNKIRAYREQSVQPQLTQFPEQMF